MGNFAVHSKKGLHAFLWALLLIIPILFWKTDFSFIEFIKNFWRIPLCLGITYLGALFPDIDIKSKSQKIIYVLLLILLSLLIAYHYYGWAAGIGFFAVWAIITKHRGFLHSIFAAVIIPVPLLFIPLFINLSYKSIGYEFYIAALFGYLSHLQADKPQKGRNSEQIK
ncbi:hypothetical protein GF337_18585 [candidate division KSB1 bacterium]|nr:hypothetical protein [candidate division KSB1 bacterium]